MMITNEGKRVSDDDVRIAKAQEQGLTTDQLPASQPSVSGFKKKIYSKPLDTADGGGKRQIDNILNSLATTYENKHGADLHQATSEAARKQMRIARLKEQQTVTAADGDFNVGIISDPKANEWQKEQTLKKIQMVREMKKRQILTGDSTLVK